jgi:hypothetical protein
VRRFIVQGGQSELLHVVLALASAGRFACCLNRRQEQRNQDADDRDHNEQLDQRKTV